MHLMPSLGVRQPIPQVSQPWRAEHRRDEAPNTQGKRTTNTGSLPHLTRACKPLKELHFSALKGSQHLYDVFHLSVNLIEGHATAFINKFAVVRALRKELQRLHPLG